MGIIEKEIILNDQLSTSNVTDQEASGNGTQTGKETNVSRERKPYDGSYAHGVSPKNVETILEYDRSLDRLEKRFNFLRDEYVSVQERFTASDDTSDRAKLLKEANSKEAQLTTILELKGVLTSLREKIKERESEAQKAVTFKDFSF